MQKQLEDYNVEFPRRYAYELFKNNEQDQYHNDDKSKKRDLCQRTNDNNCLFMLESMYDTQMIEGGSLWVDGQIISKAFKMVPLASSLGAQYYENKTVYISDETLKPRWRISVLYTKYVNDSVGFVKNE